MLVGATGSGKSTMVDSFINYIVGVDYKDPFRFSMVDLEKEEETKMKNQVCKWIWSIWDINATL